MIQVKVSKGNVIFVRDIGHLSAVLMNEFEKCQVAALGISNADKFFGRYNNVYVEQDRSGVSSRQRMPVYGGL